MSFVGFTWNSRVSLPLRVAGHDLVAGTGVASVCSRNGKRANVLWPVFPPCSWRLSRGSRRCPFVEVGLTTTRPARSKKKTQVHQFRPKMVHLARPVHSSVRGADPHVVEDDVQCFADIRLGPATLYGAITRLEERRWIRLIGSGDRRQPCTITSAGREHLMTQLQQLDPVVKAASRRLKQA